MFYYRWEWLLQANPEALWPIMSNTNRLNYDAGIPPVELVDKQPKSLKRRMRLRMFGMPIEWDEPPFEWVRPQYFCVVRRYVRGPVAEMQVRIELHPQPEGNTRLVSQLWAQPTNILGLVAIPLQVGIISARAFERVIRNYERLALEQQSKASLATQKQSQPLSLSYTTHALFAPGGHKRLATLRDTLLTEYPNTALIDRLTQFIEQGDDLSLAQIRPYVLADEWQVPRRSVLELCLIATRVGILDLRWNLLCPQCRVAKITSSTLGNVQSQVHCETCNIDFSVNFDRSVEITFQPNPTIREIISQEYCIGSPQTTPHIAVQQLLSAGTSRTVHPLLEPGRYRLRSIGLRGGQYLYATQDGQTELTLSIHTDGWSNEEPMISLEPVIHLENRTHEQQLLILERMEWSDQAVTAAEVTTLQIFRDLFSNEALRPGEQIAVGSLTLMFTDLRDSTRLYRQIGDAPAFGLVMSHFDVLREAIMAEDGAIVKTIGDAVMAVFRRPVNALRAILRASETLNKSLHPNSPLLILKAGIHTGPCIAVTLNERLDYFGSTVNIAARLVGLSSGQETILSDTVKTDPEVAEFLNTQTNALVIEPFEAQLKGFDVDRFKLWRVSAHPVD